MDNQFFLNGQAKYYIKITKKGNTNFLVCNSELIDSSPVVASGGIPGVLVLHLLDTMKIDDPFSQSTIQFFIPVLICHSKQRITGLQLIFV